MLVCANQKCGDPALEKHGACRVHVRNEYNRWILHIKYGLVREFMLVDWKEFLVNRDEKLWGNRQN